MMKCTMNISIYCICIIFSLSIANPVVQAQIFNLSNEDIIKYTPEWKGERFPDGRPKVPDDVLERMEKVSIEEAWSVLKGDGYPNQFVSGWEEINPGITIVGRAVTAMYIPIRKEVDKIITDEGHKKGRIGGQVSWTIDTLVKDDIYVADVVCEVNGAPIIGSNLGTSIFAKTGKGVVFDGYVRDLEGLESIKGFNGFVRGFHPSWAWGPMLIGINTPVAIGEVTVMPGDVVLAKRTGVIFIPPQLAEAVLKTSETLRLRDAFGFARLREGKYTPGQIDGGWTDEIEKDYSQWLKDNIDNLPVPRKQIEELLKERKL
jgi:4-hydroxy-4-methyl-2-oxoglutarate aldolase